MIDVRKLKIALFVISAAVSLFSLRDRAVVTTVPNANPPVAEAYRAPVEIQPLTLRPAALAPARTQPQGLTGSSPGDPFEPDFPSQDSSVGAPGDITSAKPPVPPASPPAPPPAPPTTIIYGFSGMNSPPDTDDEDDDAGGGGTNPSTTPPPPAIFITGLTPNSGAPGTNVIIQGANFDSASSNNIVKFGSVSAASVTRVSANQLRATVPQLSLIHI